MSEAVEPRDLCCEKSKGFNDEVRDARQYRIGTPRQEELGGLAAWSMPRQDSLDSVERHWVQHAVSSCSVGTARRQLPRGDGVQIRIRIPLDLR